MRLGEGEGGDCALLDDVMYQSQFVSFGPPNYVRTYVHVTVYHFIALWHKVTPRYISPLHPHAHVVQVQTQLLVPS